MTSYKLFSNSKLLGAISGEIQGLFNRITAFDIKRKITVILFFHILCANLMKLAGIFRDLEHLYDFQTISYGSHFVFQNEAKILHRQVFIAINIPCKFSEEIFVNE